MTNKLFFDIETKSLDEIDFWVNMMMKDVSYPANYKDPEKIEAYMAEKRQAQIEKSALDNDLGQIRALGFAFSDEPDKITVLVDSEVSEKLILGEFWNALRMTHGHCVGYNILNFDLPFLLKRSLVLKVKPIVRPQLARYRNEPVTDLYQILYNWQPGRGLKWVAKRYGIPVEVPDVDGSMVKDMSDDELTAYCKSDIKLLFSLHDLMDGIYF